MRITLDNENQQLSREFLTFETIGSSESRSDDFRVWLSNSLEVSSPVIDNQLACLLNTLLRINKETILIVLIFSFRVGILIFEFSFRSFLRVEFEVNTFHRSDLNIYKKDYEPSFASSRWLVVG